MKNIAKSLLPILISIYGLLYVTTFLPTIFTGENFSLNGEEISILIMMLLFVTAAVLSWFNALIASYLLMFWHFMVWVLSYLFWTDAGMVLFFAFPALLLAIFLNIKYKRQKHKLVNKQRWNQTLGLLLANCGVTYLLVIFSDIYGDGFQKYFEMPYLIFFFLALLFLFGFWFSMENKLQSGIFLILWYIVLAIAALSYVELRNEGPITIFGAPILVIGILYIINYFLAPQKTISME